MLALEAGSFEITTAFAGRLGTVAVCVSCVLTSSPLPPPGGCMLALEAGSFEITTAFAGRLGTVAVSAHSALLGICTYTFISFPFAVATAATIRVGNLLGAGLAQQVGQRGGCLGLTGGSSVHGQAQQVGACGLAQE